MRKLIIALTMMPVMALAQTLEECQQAAERNYPLIQQYDLISKTTELTVSNIQKGWLPKISASAQTTYQSDVASWPEEIQNIYTTMGLDMKGLTKDQYKIGIDVQQIVFDGGDIRSQKEIAIAHGQVQQAQNEVNLYNVRKRVNEMYFALLLIDEQIKLNADLQELLAGNERKLKSMKKNGTAAESDWYSVKAERLGVVQQGVNLQSQRQALVMMLSTFCGIDVKEIQTPQLTFPLEGHKMGAHPELKVINAQLRLADAQEQALKSALMPKLGVFTQGFYGYPGYNMFKDMMGHKWSLNGMIGARLTWNIGALYTRKNDRTKLQLQRDMAENSRDVFLFNNNIEQIKLNENIARYQRLMDDDEEIISLRSSVRKATESKLTHGIIDVNDLVKVINSENHARIQQTVHKIEMLKEMYELKYVTNN